MSRRERSALIDALIDGDISEADFLRLEAELSVDPEARKEYYDRLALGALLEAEATAQPKAARDRGPVYIWRWAAVGMAAALVFSFIVIGGFVSSTRGPQIASAAPVEQGARGFGLLVGQSETVWAGQAAMPDGALLQSGRLRLDSGVAQIELFSGVSLVIEGGAEFEIVSPMEMVVSAGRVRARVPEAAHGFRIHSPDGQVVDLGTEFALNVAGGRSELHVFDGEVEWYPQSSAMRKIERGEALGWSPDGTPTALAANPSGFVGLAEFTQQLASTRQTRQARWIESTDELLSDPRLVTFYQMGAPEKWSRRLANRSAASLVGEGAVVGAAQVANRWGTPGEALDFSRTGSRVRVVVPGEYRSLTLMCWVKINSLDRWYNSLFLTDGHDLHEPHWQIMDDGRLFFSVKKRDAFDKTKGERDKHIFFSPPFWNASLSGQWLMIATTYDVDAKAVTHYLNGVALSSEAVTDEYLVETVSIGAASIGNWDLPSREDAQFAVRNLNGSMDEFALFSAALSSDEIAQLYQHGKP